MRVEMPELLKKLTLERRPPKNVLKQEIKDSNFSAVGRKYGVSDNAIRKWCKFYNLPQKTRNIKTMEK